MGIIKNIPRRYPLAAGTGMGPEIGASGLPPRRHPGLMAAAVPYQCPSHNVMANRERGGGLECRAPAAPATDSSGAGYPCLAHIAATAGRACLISPCNLIYKQGTFELKSNHPACRKLQSCSYICMEKLWFCTWIAFLSWVWPMLINNK